MVTKAEERLLVGLQRRKMREEEGLFLAEGVRVTEELLGADYGLQLAVIAPSLEDTERGSRLKSALEKRATVRTVAEHELRKLAGTEQPQGVLVVGRIPMTTLDDVKPGSQSTVLVADAVQDPGNLGTLIRVADAFGAAVVVTLPGTVDVWNPKCVRSSAGSHFHLPVVSTAHDAAGAWLRGAAFQVLGAAANAPAIESATLQQRTALVLGNEGAGISPATAPLITDYVSIGMSGNAESLNVGVAAGILMYVLTRR